MISACAVGSWRPIGWLKPAAITSPSLTTTAPTGTSPAAQALRASCRARPMQAASTLDGSAPGAAAGSTGSSALCSGESGIGDFGPAVRGFVQHQLVQAQAGAEAVGVGGLQDVPGN